MKKKDSDYITIPPTYGGRRCTIWRGKGVKMERVKEWTGRGKENIQLAILGA